MMPKLKSPGSLDINEASGFEVSPTLSLVAVAVVIKLLPTVDFAFASIASSSSILPDKPLAEKNVIVHVIAMTSM